MLENTLAHSETSLAMGSIAGSIGYADAVENYRKNSDWWVVFATFDLPDFEPSPLWISDRTNLSVEIVFEALEGLSVLGYLKKDRGTYLPIPGKEFFKFEFQKSKVEQLEEHSIVAQQTINQLSEDALVAFDNRCFASNAEILKELALDITTAFEKAFKNSIETKKKDKVFKMSFTATDVLNTKGKNK